VPRLTRNPKHPLCPAAVKLAAQVDKLKASLATADMDRRHQRGKRKEAEDEGDRLASANAALRERNDELLEWVRELMVNLADAEAEVGRLAVLRMGH